MIKNLKKFLVRIFGYRVTAIWGEKISVHYAISYSEALEWATCYPIGCAVSIKHRGKYVGIRWD